MTGPDERDRWTGANDSDGREARWQFRFWGCVVPVGSAVVGGVLVWWFCH